MLADGVSHVGRVVRIGAWDLSEKGGQLLQAEAPRRRCRCHAADRFAGSLDHELLATIPDAVEQVGEGPDGLRGGNPGRHTGIRLSHFTRPGRHAEWIDSAQRAGRERCARATPCVLSEVTRAGITRVIRKRRRNKVLKRRSTGRWWSNLGDCAGSQGGR